MTGYTVHTGSTKKFASNWDNIFSGKPAKAEKKADSQAAKPARKSVKKKKS